MTSDLPTITPDSITYDKTQKPNLNKQTVEPKGRINMTNEEEDVFFTPGAVLSNTVFEQSDGGRFVVFDRAEKKFIMCSEREASITGDFQTRYIEGEEYEPVNKLLWRTFHLPKESTPQETHALLKQHLKKNVEFADPRFYDITASWIMATYRLEDWNTVPYLVIVGPKGSGKTRLLDCLNRLAFRCAEFVTPSHAALFRFIELYNPTICLDESQFLNNETKMDLVAVLNAGYKRDISVIRVGDDPARTIQNFRPFSFKAIAGTEELADTLESRGVQVKMSRNIDPVHIILDEDAALELRNRLIWYRFTELKTDGTHTPRYKYDNEKLSNLGITNGRLLEIFQPLLEVAPSPEVEAVTVEVMQEAETTRLDSDQCTSSGLTFAAVLACESSLEKGLLSVQTVTDAFNAGLREKEQVSSKTIGRRLHGLGFEKKREHRGTCIVWNTDLVNRLKRQFGEVRPPLKETTQTAQSTQTAKNTIQPSLEHVVSAVSFSDPVLSAIHAEPSNTAISAVSVVSAVSLEGVSQNLVEILPVTVCQSEKCAACGSLGATYQLNYEDGSWRLVCQSCGNKIAEKHGIANHVRHVHPAEPCPICEQSAVEYEITRQGINATQRLCNSCFNEIRRSGAFLEIDTDPHHPNTETR